MFRYGETCVLCNVTMSEKPREGVDFFPLSVEFEEKLYAAGRIPGSFMRREGRPGEHAILSSRVVDRPIRPLFPKDMRNDVCVTMTVMSVDQDCSPEITGMIGTSIALSKTADARTDEDVFDNLASLADETPAQAAATPEDENGGAAE